MRPSFCSLSLSPSSECWVPGEQLVLLLKTEAKKALNTSAFTSSFVTVFPPTSNKGWVFPLALTVFPDAFVETLLMVFYSSGQIKFHLGFGPSNFPSAEPHNILVALLSYLPIFLKVKTSLFPSEFQTKLSVWSGWPFNPTSSSFGTWGGPVPGPLRFLFLKGIQLSWTFWPSRLPHKGLSQPVS